MTAAPSHANGSSSKAPIFILATLVLLVVLVSGAIYFWLSANDKPQPDKSLPNIVFIIADDIYWKDYGFNQHPIIKTPNIDQLAKEGVIFNNAYTVNSICRPSLASIITGLYPSQHGILANARIINQRRETFAIGLPPYAKRMNELNTLPRELSKLGYRSLQTGKWWEEGYANGGFDAGDKEPEGLFRHVTRKNVIGREGLTPIFDFIDQNQQQPFFIWYAPQMPHTPHNPPESFLAQYREKTSNPELAKYQAMVSWFDATVGELVAHLEQRGLRERTVIVYLTDNGISIDSNILKNGRNRGKDSPYEAGIRTPIIFNWPAQWKTANNPALISSVDAFPTLMELLQQPVHNLSGVSLLSTLRGKAVPTRDFVVGEGFVDQAREVFNSPRTHRWIRSGEWKLIEFADNTIALYNLNSDPLEEKNLATENPNQVQLLKDTLHRTLP